MKGKKKKKSKFQKSKPGQFLAVWIMSAAIIKFEFDLVVIVVAPYYFTVVLKCLFYDNTIKIQAVKLTGQLVTQKYRPTTRK